MKKKISNVKKHKHRAAAIEDDFYLIGKILLPVLLAAAAAYKLWPQFIQRGNMRPCLFHLITGYYCPGCGGTRAVRALLRGQLLLSFYYHPLVLYGAGIYLYFMITQTIERYSRRNVPVGMRYHNCYVWIAAAIVLANFLVKNLLHYCQGFIM